MWGAGGKMDLIGHAAGSRFAHEFGQGNAAGQIIDQRDFVTGEKTCFRSHHAIDLAERHFAGPEAGLGEGHALGVGFRCGGFALGEGKGGSNEAE